jgi:hypothetical protein
VQKVSSVDRRNAVVAHEYLPSSPDPSRVNVSFSTFDGCST